MNSSQVWAPISKGIFFGWTFFWALSSAVKSSSFGVSITSFIRSQVTFESGYYYYQCDYACLRLYRSCRHSELALAIERLQKRKLLCWKSGLETSFVLFFSSQSPAPKDIQKPGEEKNREEGKREVQINGKMIIIKIVLEKEGWKNVVVGQRPSPLAFTKVVLKPYHTV